MPGGPAPNGSGEVLFPPQFPLQAPFRLSRLRPHESNLSPSEEHSLQVCRLPPWVGGDEVLHLMPLSWSEGTPESKHSWCGSPQSPSHTLSCPRPAERPLLASATGAGDEQLASCILLVPSPAAWPPALSRLRPFLRRKRSSQARPRGGVPLSRRPLHRPRSEMPLSHSLLWA